MITVRKYKCADLNQLVKIFYDTIHHINAQHYTKEQLEAWAPESERASKADQWVQSLHDNITFVAEYNHIIVGFSDMTIDGHLDRLYIHKDYQRKGIATTLLQQLEQSAQKLSISVIDTEASITARPFFERHGFTVVQEQVVFRHGVSLINYVMNKHLISK